MPDHHDAARARSSTNTTAAQLADASNSINTLSQAMDRILATYIDPPDPDKPGAVSSTNNIITQAAHISDVANRILTLLRSTV